MNLKVWFRPPSTLHQFNILQEMGFEPSVDLEKYVDEPDFLVNFLSTEDREHFCSVHKAVIPIDRLRVLLDQDDVGDSLIQMSRVF